MLLETNKELEEKVNKNDYNSILSLSLSLSLPQVTYLGDELQKGETEFKKLVNFIKDYQTKATQKVNNNI